MTLRKTKTKEKRAAKNTISDLLCPIEERLSFSCFLLVTNKKLRENKTKKG